jgi:hypothetical protein
VSTAVLRAIVPSRLGSSSVPPRRHVSARRRPASPQSRFLIPSLRIGDREFRQVAASIGGQDVPLLLGRTYSVAWECGVSTTAAACFVLGELPGERSRGECANWRTAHRECEVAVVRDFLRDVRPPHDVSKLTLLRSDASTRPCSWMSSGAAAGRRLDSVVPWISAARRRDGGLSVLRGCARSLRAPDVLRDGVHSTARLEDGLFCTLGRRC